MIVDKRFFVTLYWPIIQPPCPWYIIWRLIYILSGRGSQWNCYIHWRPLTHSIGSCSRSVSCSKSLSCIDWGELLITLLYYSNPKVCNTHQPRINHSPLGLWIARHRVIRSDSRFRACDPQIEPRSIADEFILTASSKVMFHFRIYFRFRSHMFLPLIHVL